MSLGGGQLLLPHIDLQPVGARLVQLRLRLARLGLRRLDLLLARALAQQVERFARPVALAARVDEGCPGRHRARPGSRHPCAPARRRDQSRAAPWQGTLRPLRAPPRPGASPAAGTGPDLPQARLRALQGGHRPPFLLVERATGPGDCRVLLLDSGICAFEQGAGALGGFKEGLLVEDGEDLPLADAVAFVDRPLRDAPATWKETSTSVVSNSCRRPRGCRQGGSGSSGKRDRRGRPPRQHRAATRAFVLS